jgi:drug/metabolite transporter (DMT)-like permease
VTSSAPLPRLGLALLVVVWFAWGLNWSAMKIALLEFPVWTLRSLSCAIAGVTVLIVARLLGGRFWPVRGEWSRIAISAFFNVTVWQVATAYGVILMESGHASLLAFTTPLWVALINVAFLHEKLSARVAIAIALGLAGIFVLMSRDLDELGTAPLGAACVLVAAIGWAIGTIYQKRQRWSVGVPANTGWQLLLASIPIMILTPFVEPVLWRPVSGQAWLGAAYLTFIAVVIGYFSWYKIVSLLPTAVAALGTLMAPLIAMISGAIILGEPFGWREITAVVLVMSALTIVLILPALQAKPVPAE